MFSAMRSAFGLERLSDRVMIPVMILTFCLASCGQDPSFTESTIPISAVATTLPSADATSSLGLLKTQKFVYGNDVKPVVADYLFVWDNSVSMVKYSQKVAAGLAAIPKDSFPNSSQVAVMTTMAAADPLADVLDPHPDINRKDYACIEQEPGFLSLVDSSAVRRYKSCAGLRPDYAAKYALDPCDHGWFKPFETNANGDRCFAAALQSAYHPVGCEAGLYAVEQMIQRQKGKPLFRDNAAVNIIFITDEQEGCFASETRGERSTAQRLSEIISANSRVVSVKLHGIVPATVPTNVRSDKREIEASGGIFIPMTEDRTDYREVIQKIVESKIDIASAEFKLPEGTRAVKSITVNGVPTRDFEFDGITNLRILNLDPDKTSDIAVEYY
jgi:hypothetical protein